MGTDNEERAGSNSGEIFLSLLKELSFFHLQMKRGFFMFEINNSSLPRCYADGENYLFFIKRVFLKSMLMRDCI